MKGKMKEGGDILFNLTIWPSSAFATFYSPLLFLFPVATFLRVWVETTKVSDKSINSACHVSGTVLNAALTHLAIIVTL